MYKQRQTKPLYCDLFSQEDKDLHYYHHHSFSLKPSFHKSSSGFKVQPHNKNGALLFFKLWVLCAISPVFLPAYSVLLAGVFVVLQGGELGGASEGGSDGVSSVSSANTALAFQLWRKRRIAVSDYFAGERDALGCWLHSCSSVVHHLLLIFLPTTMLPSA